VQEKKGKKKRRERRGVRNLNAKQISTANTMNFFGRRRGRPVPSKTDKGKGMVEGDKREGRVYKTTIYRLTER